MPSFTDPHTVTDDLCETCGRYEDQVRAELAKIDRDSEHATASGLLRTARSHDLAYERIIETHPTWFGTEHP